MYKIIMMSGETFLVNLEEYQGIIKSTSPIFLSRLEVFINKSSISTAYPESSANDVEKKRDQQMGVLHDGTRVRRHFGEWVDATGQVPDDNGKYQTIKIDPNYYPEVARDCVPTVEEFEKNLRHLPTSQRLAFILSGTEKPRLSNSHMDKISDIVKDIM